jgi:glycosyltransferase involved in cell wall biosynthesis
MKKEREIPAEGFTMNDVLLTVSGSIDPHIEAQIARGERPEADYIAMAKGFPADLLDYERARQVTGWVGRLLEKAAGPNLMLAWASFRLRHRYRVIFTDGEQVGIPYAAFTKLSGGKYRPRHLMIAHILSVGKKMAVMDLFNLKNEIDTYIVYSNRQKHFIQDRWAVEPDQVVFTPFMVDDDFFAPHHANPAEMLSHKVILPPACPVICAVGLEFRDYPTLIEAVRDLPVIVIIAAASPWSKRSDTTANQSIPENVIVQRFTQYELRDVYAASQFMVMPLYDVPFQAGVTAILEAMAMGKAVICSRTTGQTDIVVESETGVYVPPGDAQALRRVICELLDNPKEAESLGKQGRLRVEQEMNLIHYVERLKRHVQHRES